jgi:hypothetical protein
MDRRRLLTTHNVEGDGLVGIATEASDFEISVSGIERVAQSRRGLGWSVVTEHALVPGFTSEPVGFLARLLRALRRCPDRAAVDCLSRLGAHRQGQCARWTDADKPLRIGFAARTYHRQSRVWTRWPASLLHAERISARARGSPDNEKQALPVRRVNIPGQGWRSRTLSPDVAIGRRFTGVEKRLGYSHAQIKISAADRPHNAFWFRCRCTSGRNPALRVVGKVAHKSQ